MENRLVLHVLGPGGPQGRACVGGAYPQVLCWHQCWQGPNGLKLLSESKVWAGHPQEGRHIHRTLSLGAFPHTPRFGTSPSWVCSVFIFLASCRRWLITSLSWSRGSEGAKPKQKISVPSWHSSSPARTSSRYHGNIHLHLPRNLNPPPPHCPLGRGCPLSLRRGLHRFRSQSKVFAVSRPGSSFRRGRCSLAKQDADMQGNCPRRWHIIHFALCISLP